MHLKKLKRRKKYGGKRMTNVCLHFHRKYSNKTWRYDILSLAQNVEFSLAVLSLDLHQFTFFANKIKNVKYSHMSWRNVVHVTQKVHQQNRSMTSTKQPLLDRALKLSHLNSTTKIERNIIPLHVCCHHVCMYLWLYNDFTKKKKKTRNIRRIDLVGR